MTDSSQTPVQKTGFFSQLSKDVFSWLQALVFALTALILCFTFVGRIISVDGDSMYPTLHDGDLLFLQCMAYEPEAGDIVVLTKYFGNVDSPIVKRIIATEGQVVDIDYDAGTVSVDGVILDEPYINGIMETPLSSYETITHVEVPEGQVFVMGDNRNNSSDSRDVRLGTIDESQILGKTICIIFPFDRLSFVTH